MAKRNAKPKAKGKPAIPAALKEKLAKTPRRAAAADAQANAPVQRGEEHSRPAPMRHQGR
jgi:hypothetical protein